MMVVFKKIVLFAFIASLMIYCSSCSTGNNTSSMRGDELMGIAETLEAEDYYLKAAEYYGLAQQAYKKEEKPDKARICRWKTFDMQKIAQTYSISQSKLFEAMKQYNENYTQDDLNTWLAENRLNYIIMDGNPWYFASCFTNLSYSYPDVMKRDLNLQASINMFTGLILDFLNNRIESDNIHSNPKRFEASHKIEIPRGVLPQSGTLKIWLPTPIETHAQTDIEIIKISPEIFHKQGPDIHSDIGCTYFEIPLDQLETDLNIEAVFRFTHYETRYRIDPVKIGAYDKNSELYKKYTRESENVVITPEIRQKALEIAGEETNPYLQAQLFYYYILENIKYGLFPYNANEALKHPASVFVHEKKYGDCGAQAVYFVTLCRAVGIPARATGGYELIIPGGSSHIWAEYYIPNYGWVPVDPSLGMVASLSRNTTPENREMVIDYLSGNLDPFRLIFQNDLDLSLIPPGNEPVLFKISFQTPKAECPEMEEVPGIVVIEHHKFKVEQISP